MNIIGFRHHYTKIHGQTHGILLSTRILSEEEYRELREDKGAMYIDTVFIGNNGDEYVPQPIEGERLQLVFLGNRMIPFTTYRKIPENYTRWMANVWDENEMRDEPPYAELVGQMFAFKFKGENLPDGLANKISLRPGSHIEIFE